MDPTGEWEECADEFGRTFFMHKTTGESTWELPTTTTDQVAVDRPLGEEDLLPLVVDRTMLQRDPVENAVSIEAHDTPSLDESTKPLKRCHSFVLDSTTVSRVMQIRSQLLLNANDLSDQTNRIADGMTDEEWVQSFDPVRKYDYFYEVHHGYITTRTPADFRDVDPLFTVLLVMQCAFRCALARRRVSKQRQTKAEAALFSQDRSPVMNQTVVEEQPSTREEAVPESLERPPLTHALRTPPRVNKPALTKVERPNPPHDGEGRHRLGKLGGRSPA
ncbi:hypothetical protein DYB32_001759 [Aphanomyces invadans]|uniref:WW domain-containing protein n=1 Tax=Aphanomyces invadans TaxID=157072 RepID=A0A418B5B1_9STRA|nr:hypothetical protein DYB32_001759 [Aphanomyces invadans]